LGVVGAVERFMKPGVLKREKRKFRRSIMEIGKEVSNAQDLEGYTPMHISSFYGDY